MYYVIHKYSYIHNFSIYYARYYLYVRWILDVMFYCVKRPRLYQRERIFYLLASDTTDIRLVYITYALFAVVSAFFPPLAAFEACRVQLLFLHYRCSCPLSSPSPRFICFVFLYPAFDFLYNAQVFASIKSDQNEKKIFERNII